MEENVSLDNQPDKPKKCPCCGASMKMHWHSLSQGLVNTLIKFRKEVLKKQKVQFNRIHIPKDVVFSKNEYNNFQKLRYFGLVAKYRNENGDREAGYWLLTRNGNRFCKGMIEMPKKVQTFRNKIVDKSELRVSVLDVLKSEELPYFEQDFSFDIADVIDIDVLPDDLSDDDAQTFLDF